MQTRSTELVFILDKSGSMSGLERDTIGGFNAMLTKQRGIEGACTITTVLFNDAYDIIHDRLPIEEVGPITEQEYSVGGSTALLDAIGLSIRKIEKVQKYTKAQQVLVVIITDGEENSSSVYSIQTIKSMIEAKRAQNWEFVFLGANIDAITTASHFGIAENRAQNFHADTEGIQVNFSSVSETISKVRACNAFPEDWDKNIKQDYEKRKTD